VTVNILTWNRKADLERLLTRLSRESHPEGADAPFKTPMNDEGADTPFKTPMNDEGADATFKTPVNDDLEVIVVDNASTDCTSEMVEGKFPWVRLFRLGENSGVGSWNVGFENANGEYILVLDDDCFPEEGAIRKMVDKFRQEPDVGVIAFRILDLETGKYWNSLYTPATDREMDWFTFAGCAVGFRTSLIKHVRFPDVFLYEHELEPSIRILDMGYRIKLCPEIRAYHRLPEDRRQSWKGAYFGTRNDLLFAWRFFPSLISLRLTLGIILVHGCVALKHRRPVAYFRGVMDAIRCLRSTIKGRAVVGENALRAFSPFLDSKKVFSRIRKSARTGLMAGL
jgi:GT2 family glycosyltransferase